MKRKFYAGAGFVTLLAGLGVGSAVLQKRAAVEAAGVEAPRFEVDPLWPKPLPNHWVVGMAVGVSVDAQDHVWIVHRPNTFEPMEIYATAKPPAAECCTPAPPVLEFDVRHVHCARPAELHSERAAVDRRPRVHESDAVVDSEPAEPGASRAARDDGHV